MQVKRVVLDWQPIATAPKDGTFILLRGDSGYVTTPYRVHVGRFVKDYRNWWITHSNDAFTDDGSEPTHWAPLPFGLEIRVTGISQRGKVNGT